MGTADIKYALIEKVKGMNKKEAALFYGRIIEEESFSDKDFFEKWEDVPEVNRKKIESGIKDLEQGRARDFDSFAASFKNK
jgi:hypothetical protein